MAMHPRSSGAADQCAATVEGQIPTLRAAIRGAHVIRRDRSAQRESMAGVD
jgi:hypothetical protein